MKQRQKLVLTVFLSIFLSVSLFSGVFSAETSKIPQRSDIEDQYKWKLEDIYPDSAAWQKDFDYLKDNLPRLEAYKGKLAESSNQLLNCLKLRDSLSIMEENLYVFAYMKLDEDNRISKFQELGGRISAVSTQLGAAGSFIKPEVLSIPGEKLNSYLSSNLELDEYRFYLNDLMRQKEHILSEKEEAILANAGTFASGPSEIFSMIDNADLKLGTILDDDGNKLELTWGRYYRIREEASREVRKAATDTVENQYLKYINTLTATFGSSVKKDWFFAKTRGYSSCIEHALDGSNIPKEVLYNLVEAVNANLEPLHKLTRLRKKMLGVDTLYTYDMYVPLGPKSTKEYSFEEARDIVLEGLKPMGEKYLGDLKTGLTSGWIDVYETEGKATGAYQWGSYTSHPFVLLNFNNRLDDVFTLAHEMGHALNSFYGNQNEPFITYNQTTFTAEVASTCAEAILMKYMLNKITDKTEKLALLNHYINQIKGTFFTQVMFSEFELAVHEHLENGGAFSSDYFRKTYRDIYQKYYGPELVIGENNDMTGLKIPHFYRQFYVYKYATSYAAAQMLSEKIVNGEKGIVEKYMNFLSTGSSAYPVDILKEAGVDMTQAEVVNNTLKLFSDLVDEMERLLDEG